MYCHCIHAVYPENKISGNARVDCRVQNNEKSGCYSLRKEGDFILPQHNLNKEHTHLLLHIRKNTPLQQQSRRFLPSHLFYSLGHPPKVQKQKGKRMHVQQEMLFHLGPHLWSSALSDGVLAPRRSRNPTCSTTEHKLYWASSAHNTERNPNKY